MLSDLSFKDFLKKTSSNDPVPGGGSVSAMAGALAASLSEMVANLTKGRKGFEDIDDELTELIEETKDLQVLLTDDIDRDADAYDKVMKAFRLPKESEEDKKKRSAAIEDATVNASLIPLSVAEKALKVMDYSSFVVEKGNKNAATDGLVACMMARTAALGAIYNVKINLSSIKDKSFVNDMRKKVDELEKSAFEKEKELLSKTSV